MWSGQALKSSPILRPPHCVLLGAEARIQRRFRFGGGEHFRFVALGKRFGERIAGLPHQRQQFSAVGFNFGLTSRFVDEVAAFVAVVGQVVELLRDAVEVEVSALLMAGLVSAAASIAFHVRPLMFSARYCILPSLHAFQM